MAADPDIAGRVHMLASWRGEVSAHFMMSRCILVRWGIVKVSRILEWGLVNISAEERVSDGNSTETGVNWPFDDILRLLGVGVVVLGTWIVYSVQISVRFEPVGHRIEDSFSLRACLDLSKVLDYFTFIKRRTFNGFGYLFNRRSRSIKNSYLPVLFLYRVFLISFELWALRDKFERWGLVLGHIDLHFVVTGAER